MPTTSTNPTIDEVFTLAQRLPAADQLRLIARLADATARAVDVDVAPAAGDAWERWAQLRTTLSTSPPGATSMAEQLDRDRTTRQDALEGRDVHA
jgi:hypothetical protein